MLMTDLIAKKRDGGELNTEEIKFMIDGYVRGDIADYQMSAMCMAILWRGMNERRLDALLRGLEITHGEGFFGVPPGLPNPYMMDAPENLRRGLDYLLATDLRADLAKAFPAGASFPVYIFQSEHDGIVRHENAPYLKTVFPSASVTIVPGTEHALPIFIPKEIDDAVDACLAVAAKGQDPRRKRG